MPQALHRTLTWYVGVLPPLQRPRTIDEHPEGQQQDPSDQEHYMRYPARSGEMQRSPRHFSGGSKCLLRVLRLLQQTGRPADCRLSNTPGRQPEGAQRLCREVGFDPPVDPGDQDACWKALLSCGRPLSPCVKEDPPWLRRSRRRARAGPESCQLARSGLSRCLRGLAWPGQP